MVLMVFACFGPFCHVKSEIDDLKMVSILDPYRGYSERVDILTSGCCLMVYSLPLDKQEEI